MAPLPGHCTMLACCTGVAVLVAPCHACWADCVILWATSIKHDCTSAWPAACRLGFAGGGSKQGCYSDKASARHTKCCSMPLRAGDATCMSTLVLQVVALLLYCFHMRGGSNTPYRCALRCRTTAHAPRACCVCGTARAQMHLQTCCCWRAAPPAAAGRLPAVAPALTSSSLVSTGSTCLLQVCRGGCVMTCLSSRRQPPRPCRAVLQTQLCALSACMMQRSVGCH